MWGNSNGVERNKLLSFCLPFARVRALCETRGRLLDNKREEEKVDTPPGRYVVAGGGDGLMVLGINAPEHKSRRNAVALAM